MSVHQTPGMFKNRIYFYDDPAQLAFIYQGGIEHKGAGISAYSKPFGKLLYKINLASKVVLSGNAYYVNTHSYQSFGDRSKELIETEDYAARDDTVEQLQDLYEKDPESERRHNIRIQENLDTSFYRSFFNLDGITRERGYHVIG
jgi:hypothetical protein